MALYRKYVFDSIEHLAQASIFTQATQQNLKIPLSLLLNVLRTRYPDYGTSLSPEVYIYRTLYLLNSTSPTSTSPKFYISLTLHLTNSTSPEDYITGTLHMLNCTSPELCIPGTPHPPNSTSHELYIYWTKHLKNSTSVRLYISWTLHPLNSTSPVLCIPQLHISWTLHPTNSTSPNLIIRQTLHLPKMYRWICYLKKHIESFEETSDVLWRNMSDWISTNGVFDVEKLIKTKKTKNKV